jgi:hypothetical protein
MPDEIPPFAQVPAREVVRVERLLLPDGRTVDTILRSVTVLDANGVFRTYEEVLRPLVDDGFAPQMSGEISSCARCFRAVTWATVNVCSVCGRTVCSRCHRVFERQGYGYVVCVECALPAWWLWLRHVLRLSCGCIACASARLQDRERTMGT